MRQRCEYSNADPNKMASLDSAYNVPPRGPPLTDLEAHNVGISMELVRHARSLPETHPDKHKFIHEAARVRVNPQHDPAENGSLLKTVTEPYEIPHDAIKARRQAHLDNEARFNREVLNVQ